jgi:hypothetical protein
MLMGSNVMWRQAGVTLIVLAGLAGCHLLRPSAPESRAIYFVEKMVREPTATDDLRAVMWLADDQLPDSFVTDLPTRTALTYLRTRHRLGASLKFSSTVRLSPTATRKTVRVTVRDPGAGKSADAVLFDIGLEKRGTEWRAIRLQTE